MDSLTGRVALVTRASRSRAVAVSPAAERITANTTTPGSILTEMSARLPELRPDAMPVGQFGTPEEIVEVAVRLARNGYMTGQTVGATQIYRKCSIRQNP